MDKDRDQLEQAIVEWSKYAGGESIRVDTEANNHYGSSTIPLSPRRIPAAILPQDQQAVVHAVKIAQKYKIHLYPISTGNNWGYGSANPVQDDCVIVDLSRMNRILEFDRESGVVTLEPGVTQRQLAEYLDQQGHRFLVPVTGAGPECSLIGNVLERGYGITPYTDHMASFTSIEAVLPNGEIYRSGLSELAGEEKEAEKAFKWGIGPYLDGLFTQGNFGIVTQMTIALAAVPQQMIAFFFVARQDADLENLVYGIRETLRSAGANLGSINLLNPQRVLSMMEPYPAEYHSHMKAIPEEMIIRMSKRNRVMAWSGVGAIYGTAEIVKASKAVVRRVLRPYTSRLLFITPALIRRINTLTSLLPHFVSKSISASVKTLDATLQIMGGRPSEVALPLAYWKSGTKPSSMEPMNPAKDGCGLIWYSPLVPMKQEKVRTFVEMVKSVCRSHGINPLITLTSLSDRCFDSTVPILFDRSSRDESDRAMACFNELFKAGKKHGFIPYRMNIESMQGTITSRAPFWQMAATLKNAIDPDNIIAPGRYIPHN